MPKKVVFIQYKTVAIMMLVLLILVIQVQDVFIPQSPVMMVMPVLLKNAILQLDVLFLLYAVVIQMLVQRTLVIQLLVA
jgi:hypothetical protein